jgi:hypothetical protein
MWSIEGETAATDWAETICPIGHQAFHQEDMIAAARPHTESTWWYHTTRCTTSLELVTGVDNDVSQALQTLLQELLRLGVQH